MKQHRVDEQTGREVEWDDIVKGYQYSPDRYVVLTDDEFDALDPRATHSIDIQAVLSQDEIDPRYFDRPYSIAPAKDGEFTDKDFRTWHATVLASLELARAARGLAPASPTCPTGSSPSSPTPFHSRRRSASRTP